MIAGAAVLVLAAGGLGAGLGLSRRRTGRGGALGLAVGLVLAVVAVGTLVADGRSADVGGARSVALDLPLAGVDAAWVVDDTVVAVTDDSILTIADDGTATAGPETAVGTSVVLPGGGAGGDGGAGGGAVATSGLDDEVVVRDTAGDLVWRTALTIDDQEAGRVEVAAADASGRVAVQACRDRRCDLVGLDAEGRATWRRPADDVDLGLGPEVVDGPDELDLREAPARLVVVEGAATSAATDGRAVEIDLATGEETALGAGGSVAVVGDVVTIARLGSDRCEVGIVRGDEPEETVPAPCIGDRVIGPTPTRSVVVYRHFDGALAIDTATGEVGATTADLGNVRTTVAGDGILVEDGPDDTVLRRLLDDEVIARFDGWKVVASGPDGVVLDRDRESGNPFAPERLREVALVDPDTGEVCARLRLDVTFVSRASPLPGCRAVLSPSEGPDLLVG